MRNTIFGFLVGLIIGAVGVWYLLQHPEIMGLSRPTAVTTQVPSAAIEDALTALRLRSEDIRQELARTGQVVRRSAVEWTAEVAGAAEDTRITAAVKARFATDRELSGSEISVSTSDGNVTLSGAVASPELIGRAVALALGTNGVDEVVSTLRVD